MPVTNRLGLPQPIVDAVSSDYKPTPKRYSATTIQKGIREILLQRRHYDEITVDAADQIWMLFGSAVHEWLERHQETDTQFKEEFISWTLPSGYTVSGIVDLYDGDTGTVTDYKTVSVWKVIKNEWDDYRTQVLTYAWILRKMGFKAERGEIVALIKDHSKTKAKTEAGYPPHPVHIERWEFTEDDFEAIGFWIEMKLKAIQEHEEVPDDELPVCSETERWYEGDKWAVIKKGNKKATKVMDDRGAAEFYADSMEEAGKGKYEVVFRPGASRKCEEYCSAAPFCSFWKENHVTE